MPLYKPENVNTPVLSQFSLKGKIAAVTGGARGIGVEIVRGLAEAGADVALIYTSSKDAPETAKTIAKATGVRVQAFQSNVANRASIQATIDEILHDFGKGRLDIVVANAGVCANVPALEYTEETWQNNNGVNLDGVMWTAQAAARHFKKQGRGNIIITASVSATLVNIPQVQAAYNASKAAAVHLGKCLAVEWAGFARVNCISPGFIDTESRYYPTSIHALADKSIVIRTQPAERMDKWMSMIPGGRICDPAELKSVSLDMHSCSAEPLI